MISSQLLFSLISFLCFVSIYLIPYYFVVAKKVRADNSHEKRAGSPPAGAADFGLWGSLSVFWKVLWDGTPAYAKALYVLQHYKSAFVRIVFLTNWKSAGRLVLCSDLRTIKEAFRSLTWINHVHDDHYVYLGSFGKPLGILLGNGAYWKAARKAVAKGFRDHGTMDVSHLEELYSEEIHDVLKDLRDLLEDSTTAVFSPNHLISKAALNVVFKMLFSRKPSSRDPLESRLAEKMASNNENFSAGLCAIDFFPLFKYFPMLLPSIRENLKFCNTIYELVANERERRTKLNSNQHHHDLMDTFLKEVQAYEGSDPNYFTFENLQTTIRDLIMAGSQTIHVTLQHLIFFMASNRKEQKKVQDEIDRALGPDKFPTYDDRKRCTQIESFRWVGRNMIYTQAVIQETWRLGSVTPISIRMNSEDCQLGEMYVKKGTYLIPLFIGVNHSDELWEDPMSFKPTRFISDSGQITNTDKTLTFSCGPRACPGELIARVAVFLFTVTMLREFDWDLSNVHPPPSSRYRGGMTKTRTEYFVKIQRRQH